jgi:hypothetical protein
MSRPPSLARFLTTTSRYPIQTVHQLIQSQAVRKGRCGTPCRLLIGEQGERRFCIHGRDQPIQAKHLSLSLKETGFEDPLKRAVPLHQLSGAFWSDSGGARQFVGRVPPSRNEVRHLLGIDAISLPDLFRPDARNFPATRRVEDGLASKRCAMKRTEGALRRKAESLST